MKLQFLVVLILHYLSGINGKKLKKSCPPAEDLKKCYCRSSDFVRIICFNLMHPSELTLVVEHLSDYQVMTFGIHYSVLNYWPKEMFYDFQFEELFITSTTIMGFESDYAPYALRGLENSLELISMRQVSGMSAWRSDILKRLKCLKFLIVRHSDLSRILQPFPANTSIINVDLSFNRIRYVNKFAFRELEHIRHLKMPHNNIDTIDRKMLPNPATHLEVIDFCYNKIQMIPDDFFSNMPALKTVCMARNKIQFLSPNIFQPLAAGKYFYIHLQDNNIYCCLDLLYIVKAQYKIYLNITCNHPRIMRGKQLQQIKLREFSRINC